MPNTTPLILTGRLTREALRDEVAIVTRVGGGIGFQAARSLLLLGAKVIIAEIDAAKGEEALRGLASEVGESHVRFKRTDIGNEEDIEQLASFALREFGKVDIVLNNAAMEPAGASVWSTSLGEWDLSYRANLRGPVLLAKAFIPGMMERGYGVFVCTSSSEAKLSMGPSEVLKTAQVELGKTLATELEERGVHCFSIGPGQVSNEGPLPGTAKIASLHAKDGEDLHKMREAQMISVEVAGAGFAAAIARAELYRGKQIVSAQALMEAGIEVETEGLRAETQAAPKQLGAQEAAQLATEIQTTLLELSNKWKDRPRFEQMWTRWDFRRRMDMPVESVLEKICILEKALKEARFEEVQKVGAPLDKLIQYYEHLAKLQLGIDKNLVKGEKGYLEIYRWIKVVERLEDLLKGMKG